MSVVEALDWLRLFHSFPTRRSSDLAGSEHVIRFQMGDRQFTPPEISAFVLRELKERASRFNSRNTNARSEEHTSELQSRGHLVCRLLLEKKKKKRYK